VEYDPSTISIQEFMLAMADLEYKDQKKVKREQEARRQKNLFIMFGLLSIPGLLLLAMQ